MKLSIEDFCIRCGICIDICPELYEMDFEKDEIHILVDEVPESLMEKAKETIKACAVTAIHFAK
jgi:ferredoxin